MEITNNGNNKRLNKKPYTIWLTQEESEVLDEIEQDNNLLESVDTFWEIIKDVIRRGDIEYR